MSSKQCPSTLSAETTLQNSNEDENTSQHHCEQVADDFDIGTRQQQQQHRGINPESLNEAEKDCYSGKNGDTELSTLPSFLDELQTVVNEQTDTPFATWYDEKGQETKEYTFQYLWEEAGVIAYYLREKWNLQKGDRVVLCYNFGLHFFASFLGCLRAGVTAVLVYPPGRPLVKSLAKMNKVVSDCTPSLILIDSDVMLLRNTDRMNFMSKSHDMWPSDIDFKVTDKLMKVQAMSSSSMFGFVDRKRSTSKQKNAFDEPNIQPHDLAFLQYTSGSTGDPKGVMVTYHALQSNAKLIRNGFVEACKVDDFDPAKLVGFSWLPQYHDLGLIYAVITPFASGWRMHMMSPIAFIKQPLLWLELMSRLKVTWSVAPDFAYNLVVRKFLEAKKKPKLDFSAIHHLQNAAEPIRLDTCKKFFHTFSSYGLREKWFGVGYGLAENVVGVCWLNEYKLSSPDRGQDNSSRVAIGKRGNFYHSLSVKIVSQDIQKELQDGEVGEIWISGPSVAAGYFGKLELSEEVFHAKLAGAEDTYLRTGDLGFFEDDYLFICGRIKDLIIANGANYYPQDIEMAVQDALPAVRPGCVAAFSKDDTSGDGFVEVVFEIRKNSVKDAAVICQSAQAAIADATGLQAARVAAIMERSIPKTTSGKIRRKATRAALHSGDLRVIYDLKCDNESCFNEDEVVRRFAFPKSRSWHSLESMRPMEPIKSKRRSSMGNVRDYFSRTDSTDRRDRFDDEYHQESNRGSKVFQYTNIKKVNLSQKYKGDPDDDFSKIVWRVLGIQLDSDKEDVTWNELGLTSITSNELQNELSTYYSVELSVSCFEQYSTPALLKQYLIKSRNESFPTNAPNLERISSLQVSWFQMNALQALGAVILLLMFTLPIVPAWYVGKALAQSGYFTYFTVGGTLVQWYWFPCVIPTWMICFTTIVILSKWVVVGRYREQEVLVQSMSYLRWWFVDRAVHMWEFWVGRFITDTVLLWCFNRLMGANVHISAELKAPIREYDLVTIGSEGSIKYPICCRRFGPWDEEEGPSMRFRKVVVGINADVKGMLLPGANVGANVCVERLSVIGEGAQVPPDCRAVGNPAFNGGSLSKCHRKSQWWKYFELLKLVWLVVELYIYFGALLVSQIIWNGRLPVSFRYSPLLYWVLLISSSSVLLLGVSLILKWLLIGRRKPGLFRKGLFQSFSSWVVDYHFRISIQPLLPFTEHSRLWNIIFKLYGMQVDAFSKLVPEFISPSGADLVHLEKGFLSVFTFETESCGSYEKISIVDSSIGYFSHIEAGATVKGKKVYPMSRVGGMISGQDVGVQEKSLTGSWSELLFHEIQLIFYYTFWYIFFVAGLVPAYEIWNLFDHQSNFEVIFVLALALVVQTAVWCVTIFFVQTLTFLQSVKRSEPWNTPLYLVYHSVNCYIQRWSFGSLIWGSPMYSLVLTFFGAKSKGRLLFFGRVTYDHLYLRFEDKTIIDFSNISAHFGLLNKVSLGECEVGGLVHGGCFYMTNGKSPLNRVSGPLRVYGSHDIKRKDDMIVDDIGTEDDVFVDNV